MNIRNVGQTILRWLCGSSKTPAKIPQTRKPEAPLASSPRGGGETPTEEYATARSVIAAKKAEMAARGVNLNADYGTPEHAANAAEIFDDLARSGLGINDKTRRKIRDLAYGPHEEAQRIALGTLERIGDQGDAEEDSILKGPF